jgi:hypothetical protein
MRLLQITTSVNTYTVDIDDETAIGIDFQCYDIKEPGKRKINISNQFTIPGTAHNLAIFGYANNPQSTSTIIYAKNTINYWVDNQQLITDARVRVEEIQDRISLFIFQKNDIWDDLKALSWPEFQRQFMVWLHTVKGLPDIDSPYTDTWQNFVTFYTNRINAHCLFMPIYFGNLLNEQDPDEAEGIFLENCTDTNPTIYASFINDINTLKTGHFCTYVKNIFEFIEDTYGVNFYTSTSFAGNIWDDAVIPTMFTALRDFLVTPKVLSPIGSFYFNVELESIVIKSYFKPFDIVYDKADRTLYDFVNAFFQHCNIIINQSDIDIKLRRWDSIVTYGQIVNWSGGLSGKPKYKPFIQGYAQKNYIRFKEIYPDGDKTQNQKVIDFGNLNLDAEQDLFEIDAFVNTFFQLADDKLAPDLSVTESFKTFHFFLPDPVNTLVNDVNINLRYIPIIGITTNYTATAKPVIPVLYSLDSEYTLLEAALVTPKFYEIEKWLTLNDIIALDFFNQFYIQELNGSFFINKISGFNPQKSMAPTKLEVFKISDRTPSLVGSELEYLTDGIGENFADGIDDPFYTF